MLDQTIQNLSKFLVIHLGCSTLYQCMKLAKRDADDLVTYAGIVKRECSGFKLGALTDHYSDVSFHLWAPILKSFRFTHSFASQNQVTVRYNNGTTH